MNRAATGAFAVAIAASVLLAGCGSQHPGVTLSAAAAPRIPVTTAVTTASASWAVVRTGGKRAGGTFWQLLVRPGGAARWRLVTPPGVADNAGLVLAPSAGGTMTVAFLPSAQLRFTPLATSTDDGTHWSAGLLPARLAPVPGALAALPGGRLLALTRTGVLESGPGGTAWKTLVTARVLAASAAGRACGLTALTAVAAGPGGTPVVGAACDRRGVTGVFRHGSSGWQLAAHGRHRGLRVPVVVLALASGSGSHLTALMRAGAGRQEKYARASLELAPARIAIGGLAIRTAGLTSTFVDAGDGWAGLAGGRVAAYGAPVSSSGDESGSFHAAARLPARGASAALGPGPGLTAFLPAVTAIAVWTTGKHGGWRRAQVITIPAQ